MTVRGAAGTAEAPRLARREAMAMASPLRLTVAGAVSDADVDTAWEAVRDEFEATEEALSRYRETSEITRLSRASSAGAPPRPVSRRLRLGLAAADRAVRLTGGRFDPRIVADLERSGFGAAAQSIDREPTTDAAQTAGATRGARLFERDRRAHVALHAPVDFGGIGKGLALRWAADAVERSIAAARGDPPAIGGFLIDAGGDVVVRGASGPHEPWLVGIEDPAGTATPIAVVRLAGRSAIATSSTRIHRRTSLDGRLVHHLIDPRTHEPAESGLLSVTVAGPDPAWAEVWSKALFIEGRGGIAALARRRDLPAWWVTEDGTLEMTPAARQLTTWVAAEL